MGEPFDDRLVVSRQRYALRILLHTAIGVELHEPDRHQLHELAGVVLVRTDVEGVVRLLVAEHVEIEPHRRMERHVLHQLAEIAKGVAGEGVVIVRECERITIQRDLGCHHDL
jgi:hypothetical protein